jgi:hypothetical protein
LYYWQIKTKSMSVKIFFPVIFLFAGCSQSDNSKVESAIQEHIKNNIAEPASYEQVEFGSLDTLIEYEEVKMINDSVRYLSSRADSLSEAGKEERFKADEYHIYSEYEKEGEHLKNAKNFFTEALELERRALVLSKRKLEILETRPKDLKARVTGYSMQHKFRYKLNGVPTIEKAEFYFSKDLKIDSAKTLVAR